MFIAKSDNTANPVLYLGGLFNNIFGINEGGSLS